MAKSCLVPGCQKSYHGRGMCHMHYRRARRNGSPAKQVRPTPMQRFEASYRVDPTSGCWEWQSYKTPGGYGLFYTEGRMGVAHRFAYVTTVGPIPDGLEMDHLCFNRACVNPAHLEAVTRQENLRRRDVRLAALRHQRLDEITTNPGGTPA